MKTNRVSSKTKLADALGISRQTLYAFCRLPDSPPAKHGYYVVADWRKFINRKRQPVRVSEKEQLQIALLNARLERERYELEQVRTARQQILAELAESFISAMQTLRAGFDRMVRDTAPKLEGLTAQEIAKVWRSRQDQAYQEIVKALNKKADTKI